MSAAVATTKKIELPSNKASKARKASAVEAPAAKEATKIPRKPSLWQEYVKTNSPKVKAAEPTLKQPEVLKKLAEMVR